MVAQNWGSTKQHDEYQLEVPGLDFYGFWARFWRPGGHAQGPLSIGSAGPFLKGFWGVSGESPDTVDLFRWISVLVNSLLGLKWFKYQQN